MSEILNVFMLLDYLFPFCVTLFLNPSNLYITTNFEVILEKVPPYGRHFSSSCGGLQPLAATMGPFGPTLKQIRATFS